MALLANDLLQPLIPAPARPAPSLRLFDIPVRNLELSEALDWLMRRAQDGIKSLGVFVNAHCLNVSCEDPEYHRTLRAADIVLPDGSGVKLAFGMHGVRLLENLNGTDLFPHLCERAAQTGLPLYLLGAAPGVAAEVARRMSARYPGLEIAGARDGFFGPDEEPGVIEEINASGAKILLVAMGVPRQELWLVRNLPRLNTPLNLGVGGLFDFYSERISRAPRWLRRLGMEWTWRLAQEPRRMWRRYVLGNPLFVWRAWLDSRRSAGSLVTRRGLAPLRRLAVQKWGRSTPAGQRAVDVVGALAGMLLLSPLLLLTALMIRLETPGPVLFRQTRIGLRGEPFSFWKFRSMYVDAEQRQAALMAENEMQGGVLFKMRNDPRITPVGRFLRRYSIDELPQLWNVLRGDMSLVGPRPALPAEVGQYSLADRRRLLGTPGITCTWQVSGRSSIPFTRQVQMDVEYIHRATLRRNFSLLMRTVPAVFSARGAC